MPLSKVMLVDDDTKFLSHMQNALRGDFDVFTTSSAQEALKKCHAESWDAVVLDVDMPIMSGFDLLPKLSTISPHSCFFFLTCFTDDKTYFEALNLKPDDFLNKPISAKRLAAAIRHRLRSRIPSATISFQGLAMNMESGAIFIDEKRVELTKKEQQILLALMRSPEKSVKKAQLISNVWGEVSVSDHTLHTHLTNLRSKVASGGVKITVDFRCNVTLSEA